ncbi:MAG: FliM/FliN family flagellar motor C-terminal domain-containing protein [Verrucomicrobia bacterium]|nr:FliM/FliN family flagellar motor C-terminal domain-containing protein [Verrucomicrobiota bacterium]
MLVLSLEGLPWRVPRTHAARLPLLHPRTPRPPARQPHRPRKDVGTPTTGQPRWRPDYNDIPVTVTAEWRNLEISVRALAQLRPGDLLALEPECFEQVVVSLAGKPKFHGRLGTRDARWAVELNAPLPA